MATFQEKKRRVEGEEKEVAERYSQLSKLKGDLEQLETAFGEMNQFQAEVRREVEEGMEKAFSEKVPFTILSCSF